jgi:hypothetical protein
MILRQRAHFIRLAHGCRPRPNIYVLVLNTSVATLASRLQARSSHPTLTTPELALDVLRQMSDVWDPPRPGRVEGFDRVLEMREQDQPVGGLWTSHSVQRLIDDIGRWGHPESSIGPLFVPTMAVTPHQARV